jgi:hypothetical protein
VNNLFPVTDAEFVCRLQGVEFPPLHAPVAFINRALVEWYHPAR